MAFDTNTLLSSQLHDIKNEMQALLNLQEEMAEQIVGQAGPCETLVRIQQHSASLNQQLVELLSVLKIQNTSFSPSVDEHWLMDTLAPLCSRYKDASGLTINCSFDDDFNQFYDDQLLEIALNNIMGNAKKAGANTIDISIQEFDDGGWLIKIEDNGPGFNEEQLKKGAFSLHGTKSGLGLYLIEQAIKAHKRNDKTGSITIQNNPKQGACVQLIFP